MELTKLPEKWCIKRIRDINFTEITQGMNKIYATSYSNVNFQFPWIAFDYNTPKINKSFSDKPLNYIEINIEQFKKWVLKEEQEEDLLAKAYRLYPIGIKFKSFEENSLVREVQPYGSNKTVTWFIDKNGYVRSENGIKCSYGLCSNPSIYQKGVWSEIIKEEAEAFAATLKTPIISDTIPEYVECVKEGNEFIKGKIYKR